MTASHRRASPLPEESLSISQVSEVRFLGDGVLIVWCHLEERYEAFLKVYGLPMKGDTDAQRDAVRIFSGIPQDGL